MDCFVATAPRNDVVGFGFNCHAVPLDLSSPGLTGRSSIPETSVLEPGSRGVLDAPHSRGMTVEDVETRHTFTFSRHDLPEV